MGVAFDATIVNFRADDPGSCATKDGCAFYDDGHRRRDRCSATCRRQGDQPVARRIGARVDLLAAMQRAVNAGDRHRHRRRQ